MKHLHFALHLLALAVLVAVWFGLILAALLASPTPVSIKTTAPIPRLK